MSLLQEVADYVNGVGWWQYRDQGGNRQDAFERGDPPLPRVGPVSSSPPRSQRTRRYARRGGRGR